VKHNFLICAILLSVMLFLAFILTGCLEEGQLVRKFVTFAPLDIDDGWQLSTPSAEGIDSLGLVQVYKDVYHHPKAWTLRSMLIIRNGKLVAESYLKSESDRLRYNAVWSCTKQVTSIAVGIAIEEGYISSINDSINDYLAPELSNHQDKKNITIAQLLTMTAGINFNIEDDTDAFRKHEVSNSVDFVLGKPLQWIPGTHFLYNNGTPQLLSAIIQKQTGKNLAQYADEKFFSKIGLTRYTWSNYSDGITLGAIGLSMPPRELAKIAQCVCNNGVYNSQQIIPAGWFNTMLSPQVTGLGGYMDFGYLWWIFDNNIYCMMGRTGQFALIIPAKQLVVVFTSIEQLGGSYEIGFDTALYFAERVADIIE